jgi:hypothetical protein
MITLNSKFMNIDENKILARVVDMWGFFWDQVLPYVEGVSLHFIIRPISYSAETPTIGSTSIANRLTPRIIISQPKNTSLILSNTPKLRRQNVHLPLFHEHLVDGLVLASTY